MAGARLVWALLALRSFTSTLAVPGRTEWPPAAALNGILPPWLSLPDGEDILKQFDLSETQLNQQQTVQIVNIPGYANWTETGWNVRLHGAAYRDPPLTTQQLNEAAKPFVPGLDYDTMNDSMKLQARNLTGGIVTVPTDGVYISFDFVYNRNSIATVSYPGPTDGWGEYDAFVQVAVADGIVPTGNVTINTQGVELFNNVSISGNASTYLVPTQGITLVSDVDDILRVTKIWNPQEGLQNTFVYPFQPWMSMSAVMNRWDATIPNLHFHYLTTTPIKVARPYMSFIYGNYPLGSFDVRPLNFTTLDQTFSIRKVNLQRVLETFPYRKFVLLADTSNWDVMKQYPAMAKEFPGRVQCILIRNVTATDTSDYFPYDTSGFKDLDNSTYMFFRTPDDIAGLNFANGDCRNSSVPQNVTFAWQGVENLLNAAPANTVPSGHNLVALLGLFLGVTILF
ncbi:hypothetical protein RhiJN_26689 [Ceratobasidium sp. AG-Ba]|nr:hypothetical protein RhiJN_26689 [Ceratobasidium sp. AG-Ba]